MLTETSNTNLGSGPKTGGRSLAGYIPGIIVGVTLMAVAGYFSLRGKYPSGDALGLRESLRRLLAAIPSLFLLVVIMGGIVSGIFTATEASAVAVLYTFILAVFVYKEVAWKDIPQLLLSAASTTAIVMLLIGTSMGMSWIMSYENIPQNVTAALIALTDNKIVILLIINVFLLIVGSFMDITPAVLIFTPIFLPVVTQLGIDPVHFGIIIVLNLSIGLCTPPVGNVLFVGTRIAETSITKVIRPLLPLFAAMVVALLFITYLPTLSLWLPHKFGY